MVEVVVVIFLDIENSDDGNYQMGPDTLTSGQTGKPKSNMGGPGSYFFLKTIPMPVFTSLMERNSSKIAALFSLFLHYQHLHFSDWSTQLQLQHDEPGDDRSYQLLYSFYM